MITHRPQRRHSEALLAMLKKEQSAQDGGEFHQHFEPKEILGK